MTSFVQEHGRQCMSCSIKFSVTLQNEILSTVISDYFFQTNDFCQVISLRVICVQTLEYLPIWAQLFEASLA